MSAGRHRVALCARRSITPNASTEGGKQAFAASVTKVSLAQIQNILVLTGNLGFAKMNHVAPSLADLDIRPHRRP